MEDNENKNIDENINENSNNELDTKTSIEETTEETPVQDATGVISDEAAAETPVEEVPVEEISVEEVAAETPVEETPVEESPIEETPVEESVAEETPVVETKPVEEAKSSEECIIIEEPPKTTNPTKTTTKKPFNKKILIPVVAGVVLIGGIALCNASKIANSARKLFMNSDKYCQYVIKDTLYDYTDAVFERMGNANSNSGTEVNASLRIEASEDIVDSIDDTEFFDSEIFEDVKVSMQTSMKDNLYFVSYNLQGVDGKNVMTIEVLLDAEDQTAYVRVPEVNEEYLEIDLEDQFSEMELSYVARKTALMGVQDTETLHKLLDKYIAVAAAQITDVDEDTEVVKIAGVSQRFTTLEVEITEEMMADTIIAVIDEMLDDDELAEFGDAYLEDSIYGETLDMDWDDVLDELDEVKDRIEDSDPDDDTVVTIKLYVNNCGEIKGINIEAEDDNYEFSLIEVVSFTRFAFEYSIDSYGYETEITGKGSMVFGKINADFVIESDGLDDDFEFTLKNGVFKPGNTSGKIIFNAEDFVNAYESNIDYDMSRATKKAIKDLVITIDFKFTTSVYTVKISADDGDGKSFTITFEAEVKKLKNKLEVPSDTEDDMDDYIDDCDFDELIDNLDEFGIDEDFVDDIIESISGL